MPPSLDQDIDRSNTLGDYPNAQQKPTSAGGVQIPTKNVRKNGTAKDLAGGGVLAAVTKNNASKM